MMNKLTKIAISAAIPLLISMLSGCSTEEVSEPPDTTASNSVQSAKPSVNNTSDSTVINLKEYIDVEFSGYSGSGEAKVSVNYDAMAQHPRLEMVITTEEETGLTGAKGIDLSMLRGRQLINLDNEEEGAIITSCAGGARVDVCIPVQWDEVKEQGKLLLQVNVRGLLGGHSGSEIDKGRGNANCILGCILWETAGQFDIRLAQMRGGQADNAIPREADALLVIPEEEKDKILACIDKAVEKIKVQLQDTDPHFYVECTVSKIGGENDGLTAKGLTVADTKRALSCLTALPNGVIAMSSDVEGLVQTSLNLGIMKLEWEELQLSYAVRSSIDREKEELCRRMQEIAGRAEATAEVRSAYPGWAYRKDSPMRDKLSVVYERMYGCKPRMQAIHAGLECGLLAAKIPGLDCVSIGPDMADVHTPEENLSIDSVARVWDYLLAVLAEKTQA